MPCEYAIDVVNVAVPVDIYVDLDCAASVFVAWLMRGKFPAWLSQVGRENLTYVTRLKMIVE